jgi:hypothetical protein
MAQGTRKEIIAEIMKWSATWGSPVSRELAEAKADQIIKATRPHWGWFIVFMIVALLWVWFIASTIANFERLGLDQREYGYRFASRSTCFDHGSDFGAGFRLQWPFRPI